MSGSRLTAALLLAGMAIFHTGVALAQPAGPEPEGRIPEWEIKHHIDRDWLRDTITHGLVDYWVKNSVAPNGFIQEDLNRQWKPWGTQKEATVNGQGRQLLSMTLIYDINGRKNKEYLSAMTRAADFLMKMRDPQYGGYYLRVGADGHVIEDQKTGFQSFALYSLAMMGYVTGDKKYTDAATEQFRLIRDKMSDAEFFGAGGSYARDFTRIARGAPPAAAAAGRGGNPPAAAGRGRGAGGGAAGGSGRGGGGFGGNASVHSVDLHMFEALLGLYEATKSPEVWKEIDKYMSGISRVFDYKVGYLPASYDADWKPVGSATANPGHFLFEWASELSRAVDLGADPKFIGLANRILDLAKTTYDPSIGGLGGFNAQGTPTAMLWWPQCEVVKASAMFAILHGRKDLWPYYHETLDFVKNNYFDTKDGGWFESFTPDGKPREEQGEKAFYKGSVDGPEWGSYHQTKLVYELWRITDPNYKPWPTHPAQ